MRSGMMAGGGLVRKLYGASLSVTRSFSHASTLSRSIFASKISPTGTFIYEAFRVRIRVKVEG